MWKNPLGPSTYQIFYYLEIIELQKSSLDITRKIPTINN